MHMLTHLTKEVKFHFQLLTSATQKLAKYIFFFVFHKMAIKNKMMAIENKIEKKRKTRAKEREKLTPCGFV